MSVSCTLRVLTHGKKMSSPTLAHICVILPMWKLEDDSEIIRCLCHNHSGKKEVLTKQCSLGRPVSINSDSYCLSHVLGYGFLRSLRDLREAPRPG